MTGSQDATRRECQDHDLCNCNPEERRLLGPEQRWENADVADDGHARE